MQISCPDPSALLGHAWPPGSRGVSKEVTLLALSAPLADRFPAQGKRNCNTRRVLSPEGVTKKPALPNVWAFQYFRRRQHPGRRQTDQYCFHSSFWSRGIQRHERLGVVRLPAHARALDPLHRRPAHRFSRLAADVLVLLQIFKDRGARVSSRLRVMGSYSLFHLRPKWPTLTTSSRSVLGSSTLAPWRIG